MRIGVTSQNRKTITAHAGRCRRFWVYDIQHGRIAGRQLLELDKSGTLHELRPAIPDGLCGVDILISAGMCSGLVDRLARNGIRGVVTEQTDAEAAVLSVLDVQ
jgi:predicted Fe-Mo cluster-binding NifX family protein